MIGKPGWWYPIPHIKHQVSAPKGQRVAWVLVLWNCWTVPVGENPPRGMLGLQSTSPNHHLTGWWIESYYFQLVKWDDDPQ